MDRAFHLLISLGGTMLGPLLVVLGLWLRRDAKRIAKTGIPTVGTVVDVRSGRDNDTLVYVEYHFADRLYRVQFTNHKAQVGDPIELVIDPDSHSRAFITSTMRERRQFFGCLAVFGCLSFVGGVIGLVAFFTLLKPS